QRIPLLTSNRCCARRGGCSRYSTTYWGLQLTSRPSITSVRSPLVWRAAAAIPRGERRPESVPASFSDNVLQATTHGREEGRCPSNDLEPPTKARRPLSSQERTKPGTVLASAPSPASPRSSYSSRS